MTGWQVLISCVLIFAAFAIGYFGGAAAERRDNRSHLDALLREEAKIPPHRTWRDNGPTVDCSDCNVDAPLSEATDWFFSSDTGWRCPMHTPEWHA